MCDTGITYQQHNSRPASDFSLARKACYLPPRPQQPLPFLLLLLLLAVLGGIESGGTIVYYARRKGTGRERGKNLPLSRQGPIIFFFLERSHYSERERGKKNGRKSGERHLLQSLKNGGDLICAAWQKKKEIRSTLLRSSSTTTLCSARVNCCSPPPPPFCRS